MFFILGRRIHRWCEIGIEDIVFDLQNLSEYTLASGWCTQIYGRNAGTLDRSVQAKPARTETHTQTQMAIVHLWFHLHWALFRV